MLCVDNLSVHYDLPRRRWFAGRTKVAAVEHVSLKIRQGETLGVVGESGSGKSTLAKAVLGLVAVRRGVVTIDGERIVRERAPLPDLRRRIQMVFQDPLGSLNPRLPVGRSIVEPLRNFRPDLPGEVVAKELGAVLRRVGLEEHHASRYPHEFSGGQCQRIAIARALISSPRWLVCDEVVSALDVSAQAQILNLLRDIQQDTGLGMLFISHDLGVVRYVSHRVAVMFAGTVLEAGETDRVLASPRHPYTRMLMDSVLSPKPGTGRLREMTPAVFDNLRSRSESGCVYRSRCPVALARCARDVPLLRVSEDGHEVACFHDSLPGGDYAQVAR